MYHEGERELQQRLGGTTAAERVGRFIRHELLAQARKFIDEDHFVVIALRDREGFPSVRLSDRPKTLRVLGPSAVELDVAQTFGAEREPVLRQNDLVGILVMEFATLRRMRINGRLALPPGRKPIVLIDDVYSNCQKYIQRREQRDDLRIATQRCFVSHELDAAAQQMIRSAATFFVASGHPERGADASHRGGRPGFVEVLDANHLRWPDYRGNLMYQTLGNLMIDDRIGLAFIDFDRGGACFVRGYAKVVFAADDGAERIRSVDVSVTRVWTCRRRRVSVKTVGRRVMRGQTSARDRPAG